MRMTHILSILMCFTAFGANERLYKEIRSTKKISAKQKKVAKVSVRSSRYELDINSDGIFEYIQTEKRDGLDFIYIKDHRRENILTMKLDSMGDQSYLYKVKLKRLSKKSNILILFYDEGFIQSYNFAKAARIYFVVIENNNLKTLYTFKGPHFFIEEQTPHNSYINRKYAVDVTDLNGDGINEVYASYKSIYRIFSYQGNGDWIRY